MAGTAARLTEAHRIAQVRLSALTLRQVRALWHLLDLEDLDGTFERWLRSTVPVVNSGRGASARLAANYWSAHRALNLGLDSQAVVRPVLAGPVDVNRLTGALLVTGPGSIKTALANGTQLARAAAVAEAQSARAAIFHAQAGGRDTLIGSVAADPKALGWARATSGDSCAFCAMLASRGPVYGEDSADFEAHSGCNCTAEPVYDRDAAWPAGSREAKQMWDDATKGHRGDDALNAFRRALAER